MRASLLLDLVRSRALELFVCSLRSMFKRTVGVIEISFFPPCRLAEGQPGLKPMGHGFDLVLHPSPLWLNLVQGPLVATR